MTGLVRIFNAPTYSVITFANHLFSPFMLRFLPFETPLATLVLIMLIAFIYPSLPAPMASSSSSSFSVAFSFAFLFNSCQLRAHFFSPLFRPSKCMWCGYSPCKPKPLCSIGIAVCRRIALTVSRNAVPVGWMIFMEFGEPLETESTPDVHDLPRCFPTTLYLKRLLTHLRLYHRYIYSVPSDSPCIL
jgi:hypothetical protein